MISRCDLRACATADETLCGVWLSVPENTNLLRASQNLPGVKLVPTRDVTVYDLLKYQQLLLTEAAAKKLSEALAK